MQLRGGGIAILKMGIVYTQETNVCMIVPSNKDISTSNIEVASHSVQIASKK